MRVIFNDGTAGSCATKARKTGSKTKMQKDRLEELRIFNLYVPDGSSYNDHMNGSVILGAIFK